MRRQPAGKIVAPILPYNGIEFVSSSTEEMGVD
jgi:hypothetical protein